ncbi:MAG: hypothetical protein K2N65_04360 [Anaeroplasmataceae bacterium]|nr:hypothetical protein [Anaeroplasmataceae bacterium]
MMFVFFKKLFLMFRNILRKLDIRIKITKRVTIHKIVIIKKDDSTSRPPKLK